MRVFLSGPMASGKSTVARELAEHLGWPATDLDEVIAAKTGCSIEQLFRERSEAGFRQLEREALQQLLREPADGVVALGGGTVTDAALRRRLLQEGVLVTLRADVATLARRAGAGTGRPLLAGHDVRERLQRLLAERADAYAECHAVIDTSVAERAAVVSRIASLVDAPPVVVPLGTRTYRVEVGAGIRSAVLAHVQAHCGGGTVFVITDRDVYEPWGREVFEQLGARGASCLVMEPGEPAKRASTVERLWEQALDAGVDRSSSIVSVGGGVVGDVAGFVAATLLRGIGVAHVPTTLLAMVDAAVGGKTGFDTRHGKNLIGAFHQPRFVLCDVETLATLDDGELRSGLAEVIKSAWLASEDDVARLQASMPQLVARDTAAIQQAVRMSASLKARIVSADERESDQRALLNLGHTIGHALEAVRGYRGIRHGEAVGLGMLAACRVAHALGKADRAQEARMRRLLSAAGLPTDLDAQLSDQALAFVGSDKKRTADKLRFVVPCEPGRAELVSVAVSDIPRLVRPSA